MGWKVSCLLIVAAGKGSLGQFPRNQPELADRIVKSLKLGEFGPAVPASLERGLCPPDGKLAAGAYGDSAVIATSEVARQCLNGQPSRLVDAVGEALPGAKMMALVLGPAPKAFGYAWYEGGKPLRCRSGGVGGVAVDMGRPLAAEKPLLARLVDRDGQRFYVENLRGEPQERPEEDLGEELVFAVARPLLGTTLDQYPLGRLELGMYQPKVGWLGRLLGSR